MQPLYLGLKNNPSKEISMKQAAKKNSSTLKMEAT
jgi:hypothetical protein